MAIVHSKTPSHLRCTVTTQWKVMVYSQLTTARSMVTTQLINRVVTVRLTVNNGYYTVTVLQRVVTVPCR